MTIPPDIRRRVLAAAAAAPLLASLALLAPNAVRADNVGDDLTNQIQGITKDVKVKKATLDDLNKKVEDYRRQIQDKSDQSSSLEDQIALIDNSIAKAQLDIDIAQDEITQLQLEESVLDGKIGDQQKRMDGERALLGGLARKLYRSTFHKSALDILLSFRTFSEFFDGIREIADLQAGVKKTLAEVQTLKQSLSDEKHLRETKEQAIVQAKNQVEVSKRELEDQRTLKQDILVETKASELEYRYLLAELKREQDDADSEISYLEKTLRQKMDLADKLGSGDTILSWPVVPARGISTQFHDPTYPFRNIFEHPGIDIREDQGTPVRAAAAGVIARAKDAGMGYSYVMIIHNNDISTVYGHLSRIVAKEDAFVERGEIIGYSGGMPGTPGAGRLTTGPHLHFETRLHGIPVNPLQFLVSLQ